MTRAYWEKKELRVFPIGVEPTMTQVARVVALDEISLESNVCNSFPRPPPPSFYVSPYSKRMAATRQIQNIYRYGKSFSVDTFVETIF